ncbi:MAG: VWA domain-containing protein [Deltaproteobacteria bacterium]|nr:VWA domain-containing protein [Deltaproteobacteria bacterium]
MVSNITQNRLKYKTAIVMAAVLLSVISIVFAAWGQGIQQVTINYIETLAAPDQFGNRVRAYVTVSAVDQTTVSGMSLSNFEALEDGREIEIQDVSQAAEPMAVILAIDTSGSMQARDKSGRTSMEAAKGAAVEFISMLGQNDQVALFSFNNESHLHLDFSTDHKAATDSVKALRAKHLASTRLYDTALEAVKKASEIPSGRRAVILLTDGKDEKGKGPCSIHSSNDVIDAATTRTPRSSGVWPVSPADGACSRPPWTNCRISTGCWQIS